MHGDLSHACQFHSGDKLSWKFKNRSAFFPSTKQLIKSESGSSGPKEAVAKVSAMMGGISKASCSGQLPRNERQVMYFHKKSTSNPADELYEVMFAAKQEEKGSKYIRAIKVIPDPALILATDSQINDLNQFCTDGETFCVMTVDPTFSLGDFDVTPVTYRNLLLQSRRTGNAPVCIGPVMIHYRKTYETYLFFASSLVGMSRGLIHLKAFGTDGELALSDAFSHEFSSADHLICSIHMQRNIKQKLIDLRLPETKRNEILKDICGKQCDETLYEGLVDAADSLEFDEQLDYLQKKWEDNNLPEVSSFFMWFREHKAEVIKQGMLKDTRISAGLGCPPARFTTNASESLNALIKSGVHYQKSQLPEFIDKLHALIKEQEREFERAVVDRGKLKLNPLYQHLCIPEFKWYSQMSEQHKASHLKKVAQTPVINLNTAEESPDETAQDSICLSVDLESASADLPISRGVFEGIWKKASELLTSEGAIAAAPGLASQARTVISKSRPGFHTVVPGK